MNGSLRNWAGNLAYRSARVVDAASTDEVADMVRDATHVRALGSRHSFNDIADTEGVHVRLSGSTVEVEPGGSRVRADAGMRYGDVVPVLREAGLALANLASLPHISIAGAVQTSTHGSGDRVGSLATQVAALTLVTGAGEIRHLERGDDDFDGAVVGLGALGVVAEFVLDVEPAYDVAQTVYEGARWDSVLAGFDAVTSAGDSVSLFTAWGDAERAQVWVKRRVGSAGREEASILDAVGARPADGPRHPIPGVNPEPCTAQDGVPGPWFDRLPHFRLDFTPSVGAELQTEYLVPRADAISAIESVRSLAGEIAPLLHVCEVRTVAADDLWLSSAYGTDAVGIHFTWKPDEAAVRRILPRIEQRLPALTRPHWGKVFDLDGGALRERYPRWADFAALRERYDPERRFANAFLERLGL